MRRRRDEATKALRELDQMAKKINDHRGKQVSPFLLSVRLSRFSFVLTPAQRERHRRGGEERTVGETSMAHEQMVRGRWKIKNEIEIK